MLDKVSTPPFKKGQFVTYPSLGLGCVAAIEEVTVAGISTTCYVVSFGNNKTKLTIPCAKAEKLCALPPATLLESVTKTLAGAPHPRKKLWQLQEQEWIRKILTNDLVQIAEVVRDLHHAGDAKDGSSSYHERALLSKALEIFVPILGAILKRDEPRVLAWLKQQTRSEHHTGGLSFDFYETLKGLGSNIVLSNHDRKPPFTHTAPPPRTEKKVLSPPPARIPPRRTQGDKTMPSAEATALSREIATLKEELHTDKNRRAADAAKTHVEFENLKQDVEGARYDLAATKEKITALGALVTGLREELAKYLDIQAKHTAGLEVLSATVETLVKDLALITAAVTALQTAPPPIAQAPVPLQPEERPPPKKPSSKPFKSELAKTGKGPFLWSRKWGR